MTAAEFQAAQHDCAITTVWQEAAKVSLEVAEARVRLARQAPISDQVVAVCSRDNKLAIAEEWGVAGSKCPR